MRPRDFLISLRKWADQFCQVSLSMTIAAETGSACIAPPALDTARRHAKVLHLRFFSPAYAQLHPKQHLECIVSVRLQIGLPMRPQRGLRICLCAVPVLGGSDLVLSESSGLMGTN